MKKHFFIAVCGLLPAIASTGQYYYNDIVTNQQVNQLQALYKEAGTRSVTMTAKDEYGELAEGFYAVKKLSRDYRRAEFESGSSRTDRSFTISLFDKDGRIYSLTDSSASSVTKNFYAYDDAGRLVTISSEITSNDDDFVTALKEKRSYTYNAAGMLSGLTVVKNDRDIRNYIFSPDEKGNIGIEKNTGRPETFYYYYDQKNRLSDIVRDKGAARLKPDYMFEYSPSGQISQMTTVKEGSSAYSVWKYNYENKLRLRERVYSDERKLLGSIEYEYK